MENNERVVRDFIAAWSRLDVDEIVDYFAIDGVYHNMPLGPVGGHDKLRPFIQAFLKGWTATSWDIRAILAAGRPRDGGAPRPHTGRRQARRFAVLRRLRA